MQKSAASHGAAPAYQLLARNLSTQANAALELRYYLQLQAEHRETVCHMP